MIVLLPWLRGIPRLGPLPSVPWPLWAVAASLLAAAVSLYVHFGRTDLISGASIPSRVQMSPAAAAAAAMPTAAAVSSAIAKVGGGALGNAGGSMDTAIASLEARLAKGGGTADDWELLAKSYEFVGRPADAAAARAKRLPSLPAAASTPAIAPSVLTAQSMKRLTEAGADRREKKYVAAAAVYRELAAADQLNADGWADYADTAATLQGSKLAGEPETYIARALALDPQHPKALWLKASADEEAGRWSDATLVWRQLDAHLDPNSADAKIVAANLQQDLKAAGGASISGEVSIADALRALATVQSTLFIIARSVDSPGMPVAVLRTTASIWPVKFTLDDSRAMMPGRDLSHAGRVTVEARISKSGQATPSSGDLQGSSEPVDPDAHAPLKIRIDREIK